MKSPKIVVIGGGTGSFTVLSGLKGKVTDLTAIVSMADDGGSTGVLMDELGVLPPGDIRQCLVALSDSPHLRELFNYRFPGEGSLGGHTFGNLFLSAVEKMSDNFVDAVSVASEVLNIRGRVLPVTLEECKLIYEPKSGKTVHGEHLIEETDISADNTPHLYYEKPVTIDAHAKQAILDADIIVIAPGSLYTSLVPPLLVDGMPEALQATKAEVIYVANLVNKPKETQGYDVDRYVQEIERYSGKGVIDTVLYNIDIPDQQLLEKYSQDGEFPVLVDEQAFKKASYTAVAGHFLSRQGMAPVENDRFAAQRSLIRHDPDAVSKAILE